MDSNEEYHDPDYPETSGSALQGGQKVSEAEKVDKIKVIIRREFGNELSARETEVALLDQRLASARHLMHRLRYTLVNGYYRKWQLDVTPAEIADEIASQNEPRAKAEVSSMLREGQRGIPPSLRKLLGKQSVDLDEIFRYREPRNKGRKDYSAMVHAKHTTIAADTTTSLRPDVEPSSSKPKKIPRQMDPKIESVFTLNEATRNQIKDRYRIIVGNTSKYAPAASAADRSSHKWLLYIRAAPNTPKVPKDPTAPRDPKDPNVLNASAAAGAILTAVTVTLHASYFPHHKLTLNKPPFHVSRRGWGEFPAQVELHFPLPERNPPAVLQHTIKLDRHYTGLQTLGAETVVDVWLYSTPEMLPYIYREEPMPSSNRLPNLETLESLEPLTESKEPDNTWLDFFSNDNPMNVDDLIIKDEQMESINCDMKSIDCNLKSIDYEEPIDPLPDDKMEVEIPPEILNKKTSPKKKIMKYVDPSTGKIYYLEMDRNFDLSKVQEIVINPDTKISPPKLVETNLCPPKLVETNMCKKEADTKLPCVKERQKNGVKVMSRSLLKPIKQIQIKCKNYTHIPNDHCYLGVNWAKEVNFSNIGLPVIKSESVAIEKEDLLNSLKCAVKRFKCVRMAVNYLLSKIPLVSQKVKDPDFVKDFPFVVANEDLYWRLDFAKRRNIEWSRAKLINTLLLENLKTQKPIWRTKQILLFSRFHGYYPIRSQKYNLTDKNTEDWIENIKKEFVSDVDRTLSIFDEKEYMDDDLETDVAIEDIDIDVLGDSPTKPPPVLQSSKNDLPVLPANEEDRLRYLFVESKCAEIGIELRNEDIGHGFCFSAVHAVLLTAMKRFAEEMLRGALACKLRGDRTDGVMTVWAGSDDSLRHHLSLSHVAAAMRGRLAMMTSRAQAVAASQLEPL